MKQLFHTSCKPGFSLNGKSGFQLRAVTDGVPEPRARSLSGQAGYELPVLNLAPSDLLKIAPVRLAFTTTQSGERLVVHSVYVGKDPTTGRSGNYFTHLLFDVPPNITARQVIESWQSPEWQMADDDSIEVKLPERDDIPVGTMSAEQLVGFLDVPVNFELCRLFLNAWLTSGPEARFCLAAPAESVIHCLDALTRLLPPELVPDLTFSTYECRPTTSFAKVTGTWMGPPASSNRDLPETCYRGQFFGINYWLDNKCSKRPQLAVAGGLLRLLAAGESSAARDFLNELTSECRTDATLFDLAWRTLHEPGLLSAADLPAFAQVPELRKRLFASDERLELLVTAAVGDPEFAGQVFHTFATDAPSHCDQLAAVIDREWRKRLESAAPDSVRDFLEGFAFKLPPALAARFQWWDAVSNPGTEPESLTTDLHLYLLPHMLNERRLPLHEPEWRMAWLTVSADRFVAFSALHLPEEVLLEIACNSVSPVNFDLLIDFVTDRPHLLAECLPRLGSRFAPEHFTRLFEGVVTNCGPSINVLDVVLKIHGRISAGIVDDCLLFALDRRQISIETLARSTMSAHLSADLTNHCVNELVGGFRAGRLSPDDALLTFVQKACAGNQLEPSIQAAAAGLLEQLNAVREFFAHPRFADEHSTLDDGRDKRALEDTIDSLKAMPPTDRRQTAIKLFDHALAQLSQTTVRHQLTACFLAFGALEEAISPGELYARLNSRIRNDNAKHPPLGLIVGVVIRGFGRDGRCDRRTAESLLGYLDDGSGNISMWLDGQSKGWPYNVREEWSRYRRRMNAPDSHQEPPSQPPPPRVEAVQKKSGGFASFIGGLFSPQPPPGSDDRSKPWPRLQSESDGTESLAMSHQDQREDARPPSKLAAPASQNISAGATAVGRFGLAQRLNSAVQSVTQTIVEVLKTLLFGLLFVFAFFTLFQLVYHWRF